MNGAFEKLHASLQGVLLERFGWDALRPVQEEAYPVIIRGYDTLIIAPTAGGKTEAALIPVIDRILKTGSEGVSCLYLAPLKALINDQIDRFSRFCIPAGVLVSAWHGDVPRSERSWEEGETPDILMTTPESLGVLLQGKRAPCDLARLQAVIIDEAHAFVESVRGVQMLALLDRIDEFSKNPVQRIALSATVGNPAEILTWISGDRRESRIVRVSSEPREKIISFHVIPEVRTKPETMKALVREKKSLVFVQSRSVAESLVRGISRPGMHVSIHHSSLSPLLRKSAEDAMKGDGPACIICTSTLELGIDLGALDTVLQIGPPQTVASFLQRLGRTGRRGRPASIAFVVRDVFELLVCTAILEAALRGEAEPLYPPGHPYPVIAQQMLLSLLRNQRIGRERLVSEILSLKTFSWIDGAEARTIIDFCISSGYLVSDGDLLMPGPRAEEEYGRSNWKEIYSHIGGSDTYSAITPDGEVIGSLDARFLASGKKKGSFSLGGSGWEVLGTDESKKVVVLGQGDGMPGPAFWSGGKGWLSPLVCRSIGAISERGGTVLEVGPREKEWIGEAIMAFPRDSGPGKLVCTVEEVPGKGKTARIVTFGGGDFNRVLSLLLKEELPRPYRITFDDLTIRIPRIRKSETAGSVAAAVRRACRLSPAEAYRRLPEPDKKSVKFGGMVPDELFATYVFMDLYGAGRIIPLLSGMEVMAWPSDPEEGDPLSGTFDEP